MNFKIWIENDDYLNSKQFGKGVAHRFSGQDIEIDGFVEIDFRESEYNSKNKRILAHYKIYDIDHQIIKVGSINYYDIPSSAVVYIVYEIAKQNDIYKPSNLILVDGQLEGGGAGIAQPKFNLQKFQPYMKQIRQYL